MLIPVNESVVEISNASLRNGELHLSSFSEIKLSGQALENVIIEKPVFNKKISEFNPNDNVSTRAVIVQMYEPRFFEICPECRKKASDGECQTHGKVNSEKRALVGLVIDDGTDSTRAVIFSDVLEKMMDLKDLEDMEKFAIKKKDLLGKEMIISGNVRKNQMYGNNEFIISEMKDVDIDALIAELEK